METRFHLAGPTALSLIVLAGMTLAVFAPVVSYQFINVDDGVYVTANPHVQQGLTWHNAAWALTALEAANWHPVTWLSHMLDVTLFGLNPGGHHGVSLLIHTLNVIFLFVWLRSMTGELWQSAVVAAMFAVHPLGLESVAWIAERKNVLSTLFLLLTLCAYVGYARKPGVLRYLLVAFLFTLGLMSKPMLVTLPFVLLLLDYWPLGRLGLAPKAAAAEQQMGARAWAPANNAVSATVLFGRCAEKLPLLLLAAGSAVLTLKAQAMDSEIKVVSLSSRVANALLSYGTYLWQMVWPSKLAIFYPYRDRAIFSWQVMVSLVSICLITTLAIWQIKKRPYLAVGWFWYLGTLVPAVGLVHVGDIAHADRYTYVPLWGIFIAIVWGAADLATRFPVLRYGVISAAGLAIVGLATATTRDISDWHDGISISEHSLAVTGPNCLMEKALGEAFYNQGRTDEALEHLALSAQIQPTDTALFEIGTIEFQQKKFGEAAFYYRKALQYPGEAQMSAQIHNNLAVLEMQQGSLDDAEKDFATSVALDPSSARHHVAYGWLLAKQARYDEAILQYEEAVKIAPDALAYFSLGSALEGQHKLSQAADAYHKTLTLAPGFQEAQLRLNAIAGNPR
ncbi:MAG TPA: tetratricopeptide repeat protein [Terriglobales bacterium]|jgi:Flp pilus assembly protein TadD|nr:tetratricopeptide repeat protein [Terriglobales bacterium]